MSTTAFLGTINPGPDYRDRLDAMLGFDLSSKRCIETCTYLTPRWQAYALDNRNNSGVVVLLERAFGSNVYRFETRDEFRAWVDAGYAMMGDPETGRR